jgi:hypothetical protein
VELDAGDCLRVAAVEAFGQPENRRKRADGAAPAPADLAERPVALLRRALAMVARDERDGFDLVGLESAQIAVRDQIVRVLVVPLVADVDADVVQERGVLEPLAFPIGQAMNAASLIEQRQREPGDLIRVFRPVIAPFGELDDTAPPDVGIAIGLRDLLAVPRDVIEHEPLAQRQVAQRDLAGAKPLDDRVEQDRAGD